MRSSVLVKRLIGTDGPNRRKIELSVNNADKRNAETKFLSVQGVIRGRKLPKQMSYSGISAAQRKEAADWVKHCFYQWAFLKCNAPPALNSEDAEVAETITRRWGADLMLGSPAPPANRQATAMARPSSLDRRPECCGARRD